MLSVTTKSGIYNGYKVIGTQTLGLRGLVLWLKFNEGSGNIAYDSSFYNNHGTIYGATWTDGKFGKALSLDGVDDYVEVPDSESLNITDEITIVAWVKPISWISGREQWIVHKYSPGWLLYAWSDNDLRFIINNRTDIDHIVVPLPPLNQWSHIVATVENGNIVTIYKNGEYVDSKTLSVSLDSNTLSTRPVQIGGKSTENKCFNGLIDEVRIYNRALSENEIKMLYYNRIGAVPSKTI